MLFGATTTVPGTLWKKYPYAEVKTPVAPVGPVPPIRPVEPVAPVKPVGPVKPVAPVKPIGPVRPVGPIGPVKPIAPVKPVGPIAPVEPVKPQGPIGPVLPRLPGFAIISRDKHSAECLDLKWTGDDMISNGGKNLHDVSSKTHLWNLSTHLKNIQT